MGTRIVIVSFSVALKTTVKREMARFGADIVSVNSMTEASAQMSNTQPNVILLDIDIPIQPNAYLKNMVQKNNALIIMTGSQTGRAFDFFQCGLKEFLIKPTNFNTADGREYIESLYGRVKQFEMTVPKVTSMSAMLNTVDTNDTIITIASSTGGTEALYQILPMLPPQMPPILVVQHMPKVFTRLFADRLDKSCALTVKEAEDGEYLRRNTVLVAPGDFHMTLIKKNNKLAVQCSDGEKVHGVKPAADVLFNTVAPIMKNKVIGVILTGMGSDGAKGLYNMRLNGSYNIGQDKASCVVYGMPKAALDIGAIDVEMPLAKIPGYLVELMKKRVNPRTGF